jgi:hypothetical protein
LLLSRWGCSKPTGREGRDRVWSRRAEGRTERGSETAPIHPKEAPRRATDSSAGREERVDESGPRGGVRTRGGWDGANLCAGPRRLLARRGCHARNVCRGAQGAHQLEGAGGARGTTVAPWGMGPGRRPGNGPGALPGRGYHYAHRLAARRHAEEGREEGREGEEGQGACERPHLA